MLPNLDLGVTATAYRQLVLDELPFDAVQADRCLCRVVHCGLKRFLRLRHRVGEFRIPRARPSYRGVAHQRYTAHCTRTARMVLSGLTSSPIPKPAPPIVERSSHQFLTNRNRHSSSDRAHCFCPAQHIWCRASVPGLRIVSPSISRITQRSRKGKRPTPVIAVAALPKRPGPPTLQIPTAMNRLALKPLPSHIETNCGDERPTSSPNSNTRRLARSPTSVSHATRS